MSALKKSRQWQWSCRIRLRRKDASNKQLPQPLKPLWCAKKDQARTEANAIAAQVKIYLTDRHSTQVGADFALDVLVPEYLESTDDLLDPWGNRYIIREGTNGRDFDIVSYGADGIPGGEGENGDITHGKAPKKTE